MLKPEFVSGEPMASAEEIRPWVAREVIMIFANVVPEAGADLQALKGGEAFKPFASQTQQPTAEGQRETRWSQVSIIFLGAT